MKPEEWKLIQENSRPTQYSHFDYKVSLQQCWLYITNPDNISKHGFYPFIHYNIESRKIKLGKKTDPKIRSIYYSAHLDGWIYKYYAYLLNELYNNRVQADNLSEVAVAYRTDLRKSNINFAHKAFSFIKSQCSCYVMIGDFTDFFDTLNHSYLKQRLCDLLNVNILPPDYYAVYKNVTKFSFWELNDLLSLNGFDDTYQGRKALNKKIKILTPEAFQKNKKLILKNPRKDLGVPQGSPISAVLANIYMLAADKTINEYVLSLGGLYMRYSDDFIIIFPENIQTTFSEKYSKIKIILNSIPDLTLHDKKTKLFYISEGRIENCTQKFIPAVEKGKNIIEFLGFSFDGVRITIRDKTISKYYYRMYRKIKTINNSSRYTPKGKHISCSNLYEKYSYKGSLSYAKKIAQKEGNQKYKVKLKGNFLDYVERAKKEFKDEPIDRATRQHMQKIRKRLNNT